MAHATPRVRVNMATVWNTKCGIAYYSRFLMEEMKKITVLRLVQLPSQKSPSLVQMFVLGLKTGRNCDIAHIQLEYGNFAPLALGRYRLPSFGALPFYTGLSLGKSRKVTTLHEISLGRGRFGSRYMGLLNRFTISLSDLVIVHTEASKDLLTEKLAVREAKIKMFPHGSFQNPVLMEREESKAKLKLEGEEVVTVLGFVNWTKGQDLVIEALPFTETKPYVLIAGGPRISEDESYQKRLTERVEDLGLVDRVFFLGFVEDGFLPVVMGATDVAVLPKRAFYGQSGVLNILIAYRIPTLTSDIESFREVKDKYDCIELFKCEDVKDLASELDRLLRDRRKQEYLRLMCGKAWQDLNWSSVATIHKKEYLELLSSHPQKIYDEERQRMRIHWLKARRGGLTLEIGCATGFVTEYANADAGIDLDAHRVTLAKMKYPKREFCVCDASRLPFKESAFDVAMIPDILEHVPFHLAKRIVDEAKQVARKLLITVPNAEKENYDVNLVENPEHLWRPSKELILKLIGVGTVEYSEEGDFILSTYTR